MLEGPSASIPNVLFLGAVVDTPAAGFAAPVTGYVCACSPWIHQQGVKISLQGLVAAVWDSPLHIPAASVHGSRVEEALGRCVLGVFLRCQWRKVFHMRLC